MIDLKQYGYIEDEAPPKGLIPGRITELQREQYTVITEQGEVTAVLKGAFYHSCGNSGGFSVRWRFCICYNTTKTALRASPHCCLAARNFLALTIRDMQQGMSKPYWSKS